MIAILSIHIAYTKTFVYIQLTKLLLYWRKIEEPLRNRGIAVPFGISSTWFRKRGRRKSAFLNNISTSWLAFMLTLFSPAWPLEEQINCTQERLLLRLNCSRVCVMVQHQAKEQCDHVIGAPCNLFNTLPKHLRLGVSLIDLPSAYLHHVMNEVSLVDQIKFTGAEESKRCKLTKGYVQLYNAMLYILRLWRALHKPGTSYVEQQCALDSDIS